MEHDVQDVIDTFIPGISGDILAIECCVGVTFVDHMAECLNGGNFSILIWPMCGYIAISDLVVSVIRKEKMANMDQSPPVIDDTYHLASTIQKYQLIDLVLRVEIEVRDPQVTDHGIL
ncbi:hypothetical protein BV379_08495 [Rhodovulum sulfidophilum]|nr:hypothetical protein BV379_08495 [Rhodovulum sulfidophilum]